MKSGGIWIDGAERDGRGAQRLEVTNPFDGSVIGSIATASTEDVGDAVASASVAFEKRMRLLARYERAEILRRTAQVIRDGNDELVDIVVAEAGKPIRDVRREIGRASTFLDLTADYVMVQQGQVVPMDVVESGVNRTGFATRVPLGVIAAIAPSNSPVNLTINKVAPALGVGNTIVVKPADQTPFSALWLAEAFTKAGLPDGCFNVVIGGVDEVAEPLVKDRRVRMVSLTGSVSAGLAVSRAAGIKRLTLELGSSSANVVCHDADVAAAAKSLVTSAYLSSGQACISAQRIIVHESVVDDFVTSFVGIAEGMSIGDPRDPGTEIGPMVSQAHVDRVLGWIEEARKAGAKVLTGGHRTGRTIAPTLVADVPPTATLASAEVFATVAVLQTFRTDEEAIALANDSDYGLQAGVFTNDLTRAFRISEGIDAGAVWVNESSRYRQDNYPFGGMKMSGVGREGVQYAMEEMSNWKFIGFKRGPSVGIL